MRWTDKALAALLTLSLFWAGHEALAERVPGASEDESIAKWERAHPKFLKGRKHFINNEFDRAEAEFKACLEIVPEHADALFFLAQLAYGRGDFAGALAGIEKAEAGYSVFAGADGLPEPRRRTALLEERQKKEREVAAMEEILYAGSCQNDDELLKLPESIEILRREISAINVRLNEPSPSGPRPLPSDYLYVHGNILFKLNRNREAGVQYLRAIESDSRHAGAYNNLINLLYMAKDSGNAVRFIEQAEANGISLNPKLKRAVLQLAKK